MGHDVILDWGLWGRSERDALRARARALGAKVVVHFCDAPFDVLLGRVTARNRALRPGEFAIDEADLRLWWSHFERPTPEELTGSMD
jgi:predicted kinase